MMAPNSSQPSRAISARGRVSSWRSTSRSVASASAGSVVTRMDWAPAAVLGLGQQVGRDPGGVGGVVGDDQHFGWAGDHVDADGAEDLALGSGDIGVAGADDLGDRRDGGGAVGQRADRLGAADAVDLGDAGDLRGGQHRVVDLAARRGDDHGDAGDAGDVRRHGVHQHARRIGGEAARHIDADGFDRGPDRCPG